MRLSEFKRVAFAGYRMTPQSSSRKSYGNNSEELFQTAAGAAGMISDANRKQLR